MIEKKVECIAITDDNGLTISVLTSGNIRGLNPEALKEVIKPILPFLKSALDDVPEPYTCTENYTIIQLMTKLMHYQTRRLIVVGREGLPTSIVSMSDIVSALNVEERKEVY
jgi:predicted transcriptional regulator